ncbi:unnamed protein product, partial [Polarella glacialis]
AIGTNAAISACEKGGQWQFALDLLGNMPRTKLLPDVISCSAAISACEKANQWLIALNLLRSMPEMTVSPSEITWNAVISACEKSGIWRTAMTLLRQMLSSRLAPSAISFDAAISACDKGRRWQLALGLFEGMSQRGLALTAVTFGAVLTACTRRAQGWQRGVCLLGAMCGANFEAGAHEYRALADACHEAGGAEVAELALLHDLHDYAAVRLFVPFRVGTDSPARLEWRRWAIPGFAALF